MKIKKGDAGYIYSRKKFVIIRTILEFAVVIALVILGIVQTGDRMNMLTLVAILGCLPAGKSLVEVVMFWPHSSIESYVAEDIANKTEHLTVVYDLILTNKDNVMPVNCVVISDNTICGYSCSKKVDTVTIANHIKKYLGMNQFSKVSVKLFDNYTAFVTRAEGMNNIAAIEKNDTKEKEEKIRGIITSLSL